MKERKEPDLILIAIILTLLFLFMGQVLFSVF